MSIANVCHAGAFQKRGGGFVTTQGDCRHSRQWLGVVPEVLVDGTVVDVAGNRFPIGPGGTLGLFLPQGTADNHVFNGMYTAVL